MNAIESLAVVVFSAAKTVLAAAMLGVRALMKPTDEERCKVARRLRGIEAVQFDEGELVDCGEVEAVKKRHPSIFHSYRISEVKVVGE